MANIMMSLEGLNQGYCVSEMSTDEIIMARDFKTVYVSTIFHLKNACYMHRKYVHGSCSYSAVIRCPSGFTCEITVFDFPFYKGVAIERNSKCYYLALKEE